MFVWMMLLIVFDGELVLRNGKIVTYQGEYQVEGDWVRFNNKNGELLQLPKKVVDFPKTAARIDAKKQQAEVMRQEKLVKAEAHKKEQARKKPQLADLVAEDAGTMDRKLVIADNDVDGYVDWEVKYGRQLRADLKRYHNRDLNNQALGLELKAALRKGFNEAYRDYTDAEKRLEDELKKAQKELTDLERSAPMLSDHDYNDDEADNAHQRKISAKENEVKRLQSQLDIVRRKIDQLNEQARNIGVQGY